MATTTETPLETNSRLITEVQTLADSLPEAGGGTSETWELIKAIEIAEGTEESNALTIDKDESGNAFSLKKAWIFGKFPAYSGTSTIPTFSFLMLNRVSYGVPHSYSYTSAWTTVNSSVDRFSSTKIDLTLPGFQIESVSRSPGQTTGIDYFGEKIFDTITSIGGTAMLIYPGCKFWLYGVRA